MEDDRTPGIAVGPCQAAVGRSGASDSKPGPARLNRWRSKSLCDSLRQLFRGREGDKLFS